MRRSTFQWEKSVFSERGEAIQWMRGLERILQERQVSEEVQDIQWTANRRTLKTEKLLSSSPSRKSALSLGVQGWRKERRWSKSWLIYNSLQPHKVARSSLQPSEHNISCQNFLVSRGWWGQIRLWVPKDMVSLECMKFLQNPAFFALLTCIQALHMPTCAISAWMRSLQLLACSHWALHSIPANSSIFNLFCMESVDWARSEVPERTPTLSSFLCSPACRFCALGSGRAFVSKLILPNIFLWSTTDTEFLPGNSPFPLLPSAGSRLLVNFQTSLPWDFLCTCQATNCRDPSAKVLLVGIACGGSGILSSICCAKFHVKISRSCSSHGTCTPRYSWTRSSMSTIHLCRKISQTFQKIPQYFPTQCNVLLQISERFAQNFRNFRCHNPWAFFCCFRSEVPCIYRTFS